MIILEDKSKCCGCFACENICAHNAITMTSDEQGFLYPVVNSDMCLDCGLCDKVCPIIEYDKIEVKDADPKIYGCTSFNEDDCFNSSSGGVFSILARYILSNNGVVYGAVWNEKMQVQHLGITSLDELSAMRGSKYLPSILRGIHKQVKHDLQQGKKVLFSGTPCQVESLKLFLRKKYDNLFTVDLVCHAVPSPVIFDEYVKNVERVYKKNVVSINMRDKTLGWNKKFHVRVIFSDGTCKFNTTTTNLWNRLFFSFCIDRESCHHCRFANYMRPGDLTMADFWGIENKYPMHNDTKGVSLLLVNSERGLELWESVKGQMKWFETDKENSAQPCLLRPTPKSSFHNEFWEDYRRKGFLFIARKYCYYRWDKMLRIKVSFFVRNLRFKR